MSSCSGWRWMMRAGGQHMRLSGWGGCLVAAALAGSVAACSGGSADADAGAAKEAARPAADAGSGGKAKPAPAAELAEPDTFGWKMRKLGEEVKDRAASCRKMALDRMSAPAAAKAIPIVTAEELEDACRWLLGRYDARNQELLGRHFTVDGLFVKLARFKDLYGMLMADYEAKRPGERMARVVGEIQRLAESIERNAGALGEFKVESAPGDIIEKAKVPGGRIRADIEMISRNDRSDLGTMLEKWETLAFEPVRDGDPVFTSTLEHYGRLRVRWQETNRKRIDAMSSDNPSYDAKVKAAAANYFALGDAYVAAFIAACKPYVERNPPSAGEVKALRRQLEDARKAWEKANGELADQLSRIY